MLDYFSIKSPLRYVRSFFAVRARKIMFDYFFAEMNPENESRVLDLGVTPESSLPESNLFEKLYPYKNQLVAASVEDASGAMRDFVGVRFIRIDAGRLPFADKAFDILFCGAVLEHVGDHEDQKLFVSECVRVARRVFITTPNRFFPVDFHTFLPLVHWLPRRYHQAILRVLGYGFLSKTENLNLLSAGRLKSLFEDGNIQIRRFTLFGVTSNLVAHN
ncbi:MAG: methyltransferase domain-containing protein [bacterium]